MASSSAALSQKLPVTSVVGASFDSLLLHAEPVLSAIVHPLVLLNATDHFARTSQGNPNQRVVGILLGEHYGGKLDVTNSYAGAHEPVARLRFHAQFDFAPSSV